LARDYYSLKGVKASTIEFEGHQQELFSWFMDHDTKWLEVASSILSIKETEGRIDANQLYRVLRMSKPWVTEGTFDQVTTELRIHGL
jgi:uncharacterized phage-associated protein